MSVLSKWDERYLALAKEVSTWSKDPSTQVGIS
jgi:dCMP deaminase